MSRSNIILAKTSFYYNAWRRVPRMCIACP